MTAALSDLAGAVPFRYDLVVVGVSAGGLTALSTLLPQLPADFRLPVLVVQHVAPNSDSYLVQHFGQRCALPVREAESQQPLECGVTLAAPGYHLVVSDTHTLDISSDERVNWSRPSIDVLFDSAAWVFGRRLVVVVLTGANADGAQGASQAAAMGAKVLVQDPAQAEVAIMPQAALDAVPAAEILDLDGIAQRLQALSLER